MIKFTTEVTYDPEAQALYIKLPHELGHTVMLTEERGTQSDIFFDIDPNKKIIGIEILQIKKEELYDLVHS